MTAAAAPLRRDLRARDLGDRSSRARTPRSLRRVAGVLAAVIMLGAAALVLLNESAIRVVEAQLSAVIVGLFASDAVFAWSAYQPSIAFAMGDGWHVARITASCAIAFYLAPILGIGALFALNVRMGLGRIALATLIGVAGMFLLNQVRLAAICFAWGTWGLQGFHWVHGPLGTGLMLVGIAAVLVIFFLLVIRGGRTAEQTRS